MLSPLISVIAYALLYSTICISAASGAGPSATFQCLSNPRLYLLNGEVRECPGFKVCNEKKTNTYDECIDPIEAYGLTPRILGPNCNDGFGSTDPCRPADLGSGYYYKCVWSGSANGYSYVKRRCFWRCLDVCYKNKFICQ